MVAPGTPNQHPCPIAATFWTASHRDRQPPGDRELVWGEAVGLVAALRTTCL